MAGYVFSIGKKGNPFLIIKDSFEKGIFSTYLKTTSSAPFEGTVADYLSMKEGDNIYFFSKRKYYGIGKLVNINGDCKYENYPKATLDEFPSYSSISKDLLVDYDEDSAHNKWICTFKADPFLFENGLDADDILVYKPETFKMLRAFWKLSFIKLGEEENQSLKEIFLLRNDISKGFSTAPTLHQLLQSKRLDDYKIKLDQLINKYSKKNKLTHEMLLEATTIDALVNGVSKELGKWEYVSHQVVASPFKPVDYMDKIDIFAYNFVPNTKIPKTYLVAELKKDNADESTVDQVMKYVDWVCNEYTYGNYEMIQAVIIASEFTDDLTQYITKHAIRYYSFGSHPTANKTWNNLRLIKYKVSGGTIDYTKQ